MSNWAQRGKEALKSVSGLPEGYSFDTGEGNKEPFVTFYQLSPVGDSTKYPKAKQMEVGNTIEGTYEGSYTNKKYGHTEFKVKTTEGLVKLPNCVQIRNKFNTYTVGDSVFIRLDGKVITATGQNKGKPQYNFSIGRKQ